MSIQILDKSFKYRKRIRRFLLVLEDLALQGHRPLLAHRLQRRQSQQSPSAADTVPRTPGEARRRVPRATAPTSKAGVVPATSAAAPNAPKVGRVIGFKTPKDYSDTKKDYESSVDRMKTMDLNLANALRGDQQAMLSLVANHIGMTLGGQKGARINQAVWNEAVQSAHLDERMIAIVVSSRSPLAIIFLMDGNQA